MNIEEEEIQQCVKQLEDIFALLTDYHYSMRYREYFRLIYILGFDVFSSDEFARSDRRLHRMIYKIRKTLTLLSMYFY